MAGEQKPSSNLLEQFILLAKGTSGSALTALISQVLEAPGVYVFGELLELANVQELAEGANAAYLQLLNLFAYGTYPDYIANKESLPELSTAQQNKLKHLTIVSLASRMKVRPELFPVSLLTSRQVSRWHPCGNSRLHTVELHHECVKFAWQRTNETEITVKRV